MRQRKLKYLDERMEKVSSWIINEPVKNKGNWQNVFSKQGPIFLEIGCGKGDFIRNMAMKHPDRNYVAIEVQPSALLRALEKAEQKKNEGTDCLNNLSFMSLYLNDLSMFFNEDELSGIYLNFSDPWPKARHAKRRLTHRNYLKSYRTVVKKGGFLEFKTDNDGLFEFTLEELGEMKDELSLEIIEVTRDLHNSEFIKDNVMTEYEKKFICRGKNINYVKVVFK